MHEFVAVPTPLGELRVQVPGLDFEAGMPGDAPCGVWHLGRSRVLLRVVPWRPAMLPEMPLDNGRLLVWTLDAEAALPGLTLHAAFATPPADGGPVPADEVDAQTWTSNAIELSLGTWSRNRLIARAESGRAMPQWWGPLLEATDPVGYIDGGLELYPPHLDGGERALLHFAIAWCARGAGAPEQGASRLGVDVPASVLDRHIE